LPTHKNKKKLGLQFISDLNLNDHVGTLWDNLHSSSNGIKGEDFFYCIHEEHHFSSGGFAVAYKRVATSSFVTIWDGRKNQEITKLHGIGD